VAGLGFLSACGSSDEAPQPVSLELASWWTGTAETSAINALLDVHKKVHPEVKVTTLISQSQSDLQSTVQSRFTSGNPPAAFQANLGGSALTWGLSAQSLNGPSSKWQGAFPANVLEQLTYNGSLIGVPLALTRQNVAYWNLKVLNTLTLTKGVPETLPEFQTWLSEVSAAGYSHPLCFGGKDSWVVAHVMFEAIVPAVAGADFSKAYWSGSRAADDSDMIKALDFAKSIMPYLSVDWLDMGMADGINKVMTAESDPSNQCLMTTMGDWGGAILSEKNTPLTDFTGTGWPGATLTTVFGGDTFVAAKGAANQQAVYDFFDTMASEEGQIAFCKIKGSMPGRQISPVPESFSDLTKRNMADFANPQGTALAGFKLIGNSAFPFDALSDATRAYFQAGGTDDAKATLITYLKDNYSKLKSQ
jgi:glucose/mannose transport system substrate-binding protein